MFLIILALYNLCTLQLWSKWVNYHDKKKKKTVITGSICKKTKMDSWEVRLATNPVCQYLTSWEWDTKIQFLQKQDHF